MKGIAGVDANQMKRNVGVWLNGYENVKGWCSHIVMEEFIRHRCWFSDNWCQQEACLRAVGRDGRTISFCQQTNACYQQAMLVAESIGNGQT